MSSTPSDITPAQTDLTSPQAPVPASHHGKYWIEDWRPEDPVFWKETGAKIAKKNLIFSVTSEHIGFSVWSLWSVIVLFLGPDYGIDPAGKFLLTALPTLAGAFLRLPYTFAVAKFGGRNWTIISALLLLIPTVLIGIILVPGVSYTTLLIVATTAGVGGGNFASSMTNINAYYPQRLKGWALGINAGGGNLGVPVVQLVGLLILATLGSAYPRVLVVIYIPLIILAAIGSARNMNNLSQMKNAKRAMRDVSKDRQHLGDLAALHRHLRLLHRIQFRLRPGTAGAVRRHLLHSGEGRLSDLHRSADRLVDPAGRRFAGRQVRRFPGVVPEFRGDGARRRRSC